MSSVPKVVTDTKHQHIEDDLNDLFSHDDDLARQAVMTEATRLMQATSRRQRRKRLTAPTVAE